MLTYEAIFFDFHYFLGWWPARGHGHCTGIIGVLTCQAIVRRTPNDCSSNAKRLFVERQTVVRRTPNDVVLIKLRQHYVITKV